MVLYLLLCAFVKIKFQFWSVQPVFHIYDFMYWIKPPERINYDLPPMNKYVNLVNIKTINVNTIDETTITYVCNFIKSYYLQNERIKYIPTKSNIMKYLEGCNYPSYISIYKKPKMLFNKNKLDFSSSALTQYKDCTNPVTYIDEYISVISARILYITFNKKNTYPLYYIDNLCVHPNYRKKGISPEMIATLYYNLSRLQRKVFIYLFKREGDLNAIVPLTVFVNYGYDMSHFHFIPFPSTSVSLIEITKKNMNLFTQFIHENNYFNCVVLPDISCIYNLIESQNVYIYANIQNGMLISVYVFKKCSLWIYDGATKYQTIDCIASLNMQGVSNDIFIIGFHQALQQIYKSDNTIKRVMIDNTSHNIMLIEYANRIYIPIVNQYPSAFFLYNYGCYSFKPSECFFIY